eukprot:COSAG03_NODE_2073_length_3155_cov_3.090314_6_plen_109_part_00
MHAVSKHVGTLDIPVSARSTVSRLLRWAPGGRCMLHALLESARKIPDYNRTRRIKLMIIVPCHLDLVASSRVEIGCSFKQDFMVPNNAVGIYKPLPNQHRVLPCHDTG